VEKYDGRVKCIHLDISDADRCQQVVKQIAKDHDNTINTLVTTAAYFGSKGQSSICKHYRVVRGDTGPMRGTR